MTNAGIKPFNASTASEALSLNTETRNDMEITAEGVLALRESGDDMKFITLKKGTRQENGTWLVAAISTGVGAASAVWNKTSKQHVIAATENGHAGFEPQSKLEQSYLNYLLKKYPHASIELALSGKHGIDNLTDFYLEGQTDDISDLKNAIQEARVGENPTGQVLLDFAEASATEPPNDVARGILKFYGGMLGSALRDMALAHLSKEIYLTGSVSTHMGEYLFENTDLQDRFISKGAQHDKLLEKVPIYLVDDPQIAVNGALSIAEKLDIHKRSEG